MFFDVWCYNEYAAHTELRRNVIKVTILTGEAIGKGKHIYIEPFNPNNKTIISGKSCTFDDD